MSDRQNVLFVTIDQFRADCLFGALGDYVKLPNLRALMQDGVSFTQHFSVCAPCGPSRASILTGQYARNHRAVRNGTPLRRDTPNLATEVRKGGYLPLLFGYTDSAQDPRGMHPNDPALGTYEEVMPGFHEVLRMRMEDDIGPWRTDLVAKGYDVPPFPDIYRPSGDQIDDPAIYSAQDSDTAFMADAVIKDLAARPEGWFAHVTFLRPHPPFVAPAPYNRMYAPDSLPAPTTVGTPDQERQRHPFVHVALDAQKIEFNVVGFDGLEATPDNIAKQRALYLGLASEVDHHLGRIFDFLKTTGTYDQTLIVVNSDHGEMLGDYHSWGKSSYYDAAFHTPLIIRDPRHPAQFGKTVDLMAESVDVTPTILDVLGLDVPHSMDGHSLVPFLSGQQVANWRQHSYSELDFGDLINPTAWQTKLGLSVDQANLAVLRGASHSLVHFGGGLEQILFDRNASGEGRDVSGDAGAEKILLDLTRQMLSHVMQSPEGTFSRTMVGEQGVRIG